MISAVFVGGSPPPTGPAARADVAGSHRPYAMAGDGGEDPVAEWNTFPFGSPWSLVMCPPATNSRPSGRKSWPAQNNPDGAGTAVNPPVSGSHTCGSPLRPQLSTWPFGSR